MLVPHTLPHIGHAIRPDAATEPGVATDYGHGQSCLVAIHNHITQFLCVGDRSSCKGSASQSGNTHEHVLWHELPHLTPLTNHDISRITATLRLAS